MLDRVGRSAPLMLRAELPELTKDQSFPANQLRCCADRNLNPQREAADFDQVSFNRLGPPLPSGLHQSMSGLCEFVEADRAGRTPQPVCE